MPTSQSATATDFDEISETRARTVVDHKALANTVSISETAKPLHSAHGVSDSIALTDARRVGTKHFVANSIAASSTTVVNQTIQITGVSSFGIDMAGNDQMIPDEIISFFLDEMSGLVAANDVSPHSGSIHGGVQIGQPEVFASGGKKLLSGASIVLDGSTGYVDISSTIPDFTGRTTATIYSYFKVAAVASASTLMLVADDAHTTGSSIDFTTFLADIAYPNRPLTLDNGDPFDHTELAGYQSANVTIDGSTGQLVLTATHDAMTDYLAASRTYTSGMVQTGGNVPADIDVAFQYAFGHMEIDFKLNFLGGPTGIAGLKPVFRLTPRNANRFPYPPEIDILQMFGSNSMVSQVHLGAFVGDNNPLYQNSYARALDPIGAFHTVSMDWDAAHIEFFLNGTSLGSYVGPDVARVPMFLSISLGVGGATTTAPNPSDFTSGGAELRIARILVEQ